MIQKQFHLFILLAFFSSSFFLNLGAEVVDKYSCKNATSTIHITTHVLDVSQGIPGQDIRVILEKDMRSYQHEDHLEADFIWGIVNNTTRTSIDGRASFMDISLQPCYETGTYRLTFYTKEYYIARNVTFLYPKVQVIFEVQDNNLKNNHIPLLLSQFSYTTYRGS
jgi:5-hydroxyisourate hydrolase